MLNLLDVETESQTNTPTKESQIKRILEALLFSCSESISIDKLKEVISSTYPIGKRELRRLIDEMREEYRTQNRAFTIDEIAEGYLLRTSADLGPYIELLHLNKRGEKLSKASMEVLAIIAYKSPITRAEVEALRGVDSSGTISSLQERGLIEEVGRKQAPGRPVQFGVTRRFLKHFGLKSAADIPQL
ncbi:MAG: Segregation and condensation protein B [Chlamydiales bacterium]|nr:Segregation and condensation protein B [Chlamydiales bacterium]MCH9635649.1 Segregation and condensation protein B [Chlamydiales bacterium]MCH9704053.1 SMC-Scp complex subunit ScpB [Chlamydiota bacterium]